MPTPERVRRTDIKQRLEEKIIWHIKLLQHLKRVSTFLLIHQEKTQEDCCTKCFLQNHTKLAYYQVLFYV